MSSLVVCSLLRVIVAQIPSLQSTLHYIQQLRLLVSKIVTEVLSPPGHSSVQRTSQPGLSYSPSGLKQRSMELISCRVRWMCQNKLQRESIFQKKFRKWKSRDRRLSLKSPPGHSSVQRTSPPSLSYSPSGLKQRSM